MARTVTVGSKPFNLDGPELKVGHKAPNFRLVDTDMKEVTLSDSKGKIRLLSVVHSLDTNVCDIQTQRFEREAAHFLDVMVYTISMDLPFAQARYCGGHGIQNQKTLSDHREASFGKAYGVLIKDLRLLSHAVFIIDRNDNIWYLEYLKEVGDQPDYEAALQALSSIAGVIAAPALKV